jgi:hypothetical protein
MVMKDMVEMVKIVVGGSIITFVVTLAYLHVLEALGI